MPPLFQAWLLQSAMIFLVVGSFAALLVGALLVFRPRQFKSISVLLNRWVSTRNFDKALERNFSLDPLLYRYRRFTGTLLLLGALFVLYYFTWKMDKAAAIEGLARHFHSYPSLVGGLLDAVVLGAMLGALCAAFIALCLIFRPSLLRGFEESANQWLSLRRALKPMEIPRDSPGRFVETYARQVGIFLLLGGLYTLVLLLIWLSRHV